jgi:hypothetical protein
MKHGSKETDMRVKAIVITAALIGSASGVSAQMTHANHGAGMDHASRGQGPVAAVLTEPGQGAFAALSEVVRVLEADPATDWSKVDLAGLRAHLVDMDRLVTDTIVTETVLAGGIKARATGDAATVATLLRMVPAHAAQLADDDRWLVKVSQATGHVDLIVTSDDPAVAARIKGLGFFGLMASQDHHRAHHLMMARGQEAHGH